MNRSPATSPRRRAFLAALAAACAGGVDAATRRPDAPEDPSPDPRLRLGEHDAVTLAPGESFVAAARRLGLAFDTLVAANPDVDPFGTARRRIVLPIRRLVPPGPREGLVVNLPELTLYRFDAAGGVTTFPVGAGRVGDETPVADTRVVSVEARPSWRPPASIRAEYVAAGLTLPAVVPPGPDNPLGGHALRLALPSYLLHGTNAPEGVGMRVSHGCLRLYPEHIERLASVVSPGTRVRIVDEPVKHAFVGDGSDARLLLEAHRPFAVEGRDGGALLRDRFDAVRTGLRGRGLPTARLDAALGRLHAEGRLFTGLVHELPLAA